MGILSTIYFGNEITRQQREAKQARRRRREPKIVGIPVPVVEAEPARLTWAIAVILEQGEEIRDLRRRIETLEGGQ